MLNCAKYLCRDSLIVYSVKRNQVSPSQVLPNLIPKYYAVLFRMDKMSKIYLVLVYLYHQQSSKLYTDIFRIMR